MKLIELLIPHEATVLSKDMFFLSLTKGYSTLLKATEVQEAKAPRCKVAGNMIMVNVRTCVELRYSDLMWAGGLSLRNRRVHDTHASDCTNETMEQNMKIYVKF